jgi:hypothetical protein
MKGDVTEPILRNVISKAVGCHVTNVGKRNDGRVIHRTHPSGNIMTIFFPGVCEISRPLSERNHTSAPARALPLLPPTSMASWRMSDCTAAKVSVSFVFTHVSIIPGSRVSTSGAKS